MSHNLKIKHFSKTTHCSVWAANWCDFKTFFSHFIHRKFRKLRQVLNMVVNYEHVNRHRQA